MVPTWNAASPPARNGSEVLSCGGMLDPLIVRAVTAADFHHLRNIFVAVDDVDTPAAKTDFHAEITALEARIYRAMLVQAVAIVGALVGIAGIVVGALRLLG